MYHTRPSLLAQFVAFAIRHLKCRIIDFLMLYLLRPSHVKNLNEDRPGLLCYIVRLALGFLDWLISHNYISADHIDPPTGMLLQRLVAMVTAS